jgi:hypothetical protein
LKLALLLAQYLYANKKLDLPGIGTFHLDPSVVIDPETDKNTKAEPISGIHFDYNTSIKENTELTDYIAAKSGKIKALAAADMDSHLWLGQQFLNIGKPFVLEGIGQLTKTQAGALDFSAGILQPEVLKDQQNWQPMADHSSQAGENDYKDLLNNRKETAQWKKPVAIIMIIAGIGVAIWGGYTVYKNNIAEADTDSLAKENSSPVIQPQVNNINTGNITSSPADTTNNTPAPTITPSVSPAGMYKFVVETAGRQRALTRYKTLKNLPTDVKMETADSVNYKLYFLLPASPADTAKLLDSLRTYYTPKWSKAFIEN